MNFLSIRIRSRSLLAGCLVSMGLGIGTGARADVLEIGTRGAVWVSGGPAEHATASPWQASATSDPSVSLVESAAGPQQWRPHVAALAAKYDISPALLEALVWQESRWNPAATSPAGARGLAQLMPGTSRLLGVDWRDPYANLEGGARYLRQQLDRFDGNVEKALAAYNAGPERVARAGGIPAIRETRDYVTAIMGRLSRPVRR